MRETPQPGRIRDFHFINCLIVISRYGRKIVIKQTSAKVWKRLAEQNYFLWRSLMWDAYVQQLASSDL